MIDGRILVEIGLKGTLWKHANIHGIENTSQGLECTYARAPHHLGSSTLTLERIIT
jgi:hypothetical protein